MISHSVIFSAKEKAEFQAQEIAGEPSGSQVLVKTHFDLISAGTELANYHNLPNLNGGGMDTGYPKYPGYSASGVVLAVGPDVKRFKPGDRVICSWLGHRSRFLADEKSFYPIPDDVDMETAAAAHLCSFPLLGVRRLQIQMGESVMIAGLGLLGQFAVQLARISGAAPVICCDYSPERRALALSLGADYALDPGEAGFVQKVLDLTDGKGVDAVVEVTGFIPALQQALEYVAFHGRISLLGCTRISDQPINFYRYVHCRGISLLGSHTMVRPLTESRPNGEWTEYDDYRTFFRYVRSGRLQVKPIISQKVSPVDADAVYHRLGFEKNPPLGVLFDWRDIDAD